MGKGFDYRGGGALVTLNVPHSTHALLMGPSSIEDLLTTYIVKPQSRHITPPTGSSNSSIEHSSSQETRRG